MSGIDMLGRSTAAADAWIREHAGIMVDAGQCEPLARAVLEAAGVLGAAAQPPPVHQNGEPSMHDLAAAWIADPSDHGTSARAVAMLEARKAFGLAKYGTALQVSGPRDPLADAADEVADALVYAQQGLERALRNDDFPWVAAWWMNRRDALGRELLALMEGPRS